MLIKLLIVACMGWRCDIYVAETWQPQPGYDVAEALWECQDQRDSILQAKREMGRASNIRKVYCDVTPE